MKGLLMGLYTKYVLGLAAKIGDKRMHLLVGMVIGFVASMFMHPTHAFLLAAVVGIAKEVYDYFNPDKHTAELADAFMTITGGAAGAAAYLFLSAVL